MHECNPMATPMTSSTQLSASQGVPFSDPSLYRSIAGGLQYATMTRPDISLAINRVCQYMHALLDSHWKAVKRILRYLRGTTNAGITLYKDFGIDVIGFSDADWASSLDDRRSTSEFCIFLGHNLVSWSAKKQSTVSRSSTEAEYRSATSAIAKIVWIQNLLCGLNVSSDKVSLLWCDNLSTIALASNPVFHLISKHIELDLHFIRERVLQKALSVGWGVKWVLPISFG